MPTLAFSQEHISNGLVGRGLSALSGADLAKSKVCALGKSVRHCPPCTLVLHKAFLLE
jgi:hypothetical protein